MEFEKLKRIRTVRDVPTQFTVNFLLIQAFDDEATTLFC